MPRKRAALDLLPSSALGWRGSCGVRPRPWADRPVGGWLLRGLRGLGLCGGNYAAAGGDGVDLRFAEQVFLA